MWKCLQLHPPLAIWPDLPPPPPHPKGCTLQSLAIDIFPPKTVPFTSSVEKVQRLEKKYANTESGILDPLVSNRGIA